MLNENQVVDAVCKYLVTEGLRIESTCSTKQQGYDIVAIYPDSGRRLIIEAKGATSAREDSARFGKGFSDNQVRSHVARAFYAAATALQDKDGPADAAVALPDLALHHKYVERISEALHLLGISVYWVAADGNVRVETPDRAISRRA